MRTVGVALGIFLISCLLTGTAAAQQTSATALPESPTQGALVGDLLCQQALAEPALPPPPQVRRLLVSQPAPPELTIDADHLTYDDAAQVVEAMGHVGLQYRGVTVQADFARILRTEERVEARGHVIIIDSEGREMRGDVLTYDARRQTAQLSPAETIVNGVYIRSDRMRARPGLIAAGESTLTTCDPAHPVYRLTASRIDIIPGDRAVAYDATIWLGQHWLLGLPVIVVSLRGSEETAGSFPRFGYDNISGLWASYRYAFFIGQPLAYVFTSLGTLAQRAEVGLLLPERPMGFLPLSLSAAASGGWHRELGLNVETTRLLYSVGLQAPQIHLGAETDLRLSWSWQEATYGTGDRQSVVRAQSGITYHLSDDTTLTLAYEALRVYGATPLAIDAIDPEDYIDELSLIYKKTGLRDETVATTFTAGVSYDYLTMSPSVSVGYGERITGRYHWEISPEYNLETHEIALINDTGVSLGADTYFTIQAEYNTTTTLFKDLDYILTVRVGDCFDLSVKYRQIRQELWISFGLFTVPQAKMEFQIQGP